MSTPEKLRLVEKVPLRIQEETAKILLSTQALQINLEKPFVFSSGILSPMRISCEMIEKDPRAHRKVVNFLGELLPQFGRIDILCGVLRGGKSFADGLSRQQGIPSISLLGKSKTPEKTLLVKGDVGVNKRHLVVEDVITTGRNVIEVARHIRELGGFVAGCLGIYDYGFPEAVDNLREANIRPVATLCNFDVLIEVTERECGMEAKTRRILYAWHQNPYRFF